MGWAGALQASLLQRGLRGFFAGVEDRGVEDAVEAGVEVSVAVGLDSSVGELERRVVGGSKERVAPDSSLSSETVADGSRGCASRRSRAFVSTVVSALRKSTRFETVCVGRMLSLMAKGLLGSCPNALAANDSLLPSAMTTLIEMLSAAGSGLAVLEEMELEREGMLAPVG